jgi:hypothetical protein
MLAIAAAPGSPFGPSGWPERGALGAFTWGAWVLSGGVAIALTLARRHARDHARILAGRAAISGATLAILSYTTAAAAGAGLIERAPLAVLVGAIGAAWGLRRLRPR